MLECLIENITSIYNLQESNDAHGMLVYQFYPMKLVYASMSIEALFGVTLADIYSSPESLAQSIVANDKAIFINNMMTSKRIPVGEAVYFSYRVTHKRAKKLMLYQANILLTNEHRKPIGIFCAVSTKPKSTYPNLSHYCRSINRSFKTPITIDFITDQDKFLLQVSSQKLKLTKRQLECLQCLILGYTLKETAEKLCLAPRTVQGYFDEIRAKTGCKNKLALLSVILNNKFDGSD